MKKILLTDEIKLYKYMIQIQNVVCDQKQKVPIKKII